MFTVKTRNSICESIFTSLSAGIKVDVPRHSEIAFLDVRMILYILISLFIGCLIQSDAALASDISTDIVLIVTDAIQQY